MPGMNSGLNPADPVIVSAFRSALMHQAAIAAIIVLLLLLCWGATRGSVTAGVRSRATLAASWHEPKARRLLRLGFGLLWLFDGILQAQPKMAAGLPSQVFEPAAATSPGWVQHLVNWGGAIWTYHPVQAAAASVWIQAGFGLWLIVVVDGRFGAADDGRRAVTRSRRRPAAAFCAGLAGACLLAGCASPGAPVPQPPAAAAAFPLATTLAAAGGQTWAIVAMGGSAASQNSFWELFARPPREQTWELATPPGVADNGGLAAAAPAAGRRLDIAVRPSQGRAFSPLALTSDGGKTWATGLIDAPVAAVPDALTAGSGPMLALLTDGGIEQAAAPGASWTPLAGPGAIAATAAGRACQVTSLTAVAVTATGIPLAAASCARPGIAGIFARAAGTWRAAGPAVPAPLANRAVRVLLLTSTAGADTSLLQAGTGAAASLFAAWTSDSTRWSVSAPLAAGTGQVIASGTGPGGTAWVLLASGRAAIVSGPGSPWRELPAVPRGTAVLAAGPGNSAVQALAVSGSKLTVFALTPAGTWSRTQIISVPVQYGSSS